MIAVFRAERERLDGAFRRPMDGVTLTETSILGGGSRGLGEHGAVAGGVDVTRTAREEVAFAPMGAPSPGSPLFPTDTFAPDMSRTRVRLYGAGGYRLREWGGGLTLAYNAGENRTESALVPRTGRVSRAEASAGIVRRLRSDLLAGGWVSRSTRAETVLFVERAATPVIYPVQGFADTDPIEIPAYQRRVEQEVSAWGIGLAASIFEFRWILAITDRHLEEAHFGARATGDRWATDDREMSLSGQRWWGERTSALVEVGRREGDGFAERHDLTGAMLRDTLRGVWGRGELRRNPREPGWGAGLVIDAGYSEWRRRDFVAERRASIVATRFGLGGEVAYVLSGAWAVSLVYGATLRSVERELPEANAAGHVYRNVLFPALLFDAADAMAHGVGATLRWRRGERPPLILGFRYARRWPRGDSAAWPPSAARESLRVELGTRW